MSELSPLPEDIQGLLRAAEQGAPPPPPGAEAAVLAKLTGTVAAAGAAGAAGASAGGLLGLAPALGIAKPILAAVVTVVLGGGAFLVARAPGRAEPAPIALEGPARSAADGREAAPALDTPAHRPSEPAPAPAAAPAAEAAAESADADEPAPPATAQAAVAPVARGAREVLRGAGDAERAAASEAALLEDAREALARGDADLAIARLQAHARAHPRGQLVEERRALTVVAWALRGDHARATGSARAFERAYPSSLFLQMVRAALAEDDAP
jgi:hypothetical protein